MNKKFLLLIFVVVFIFTTAGSVFSADVAKIGLIDMQEIFNTSSAGKIIQKKLKAKGNEFAKTLQSMQKEIVELENKIKTESMVLSQEKRNEKSREYRIKVNDFTQAKKKVQYDLKRLEAKEVVEMQKAILEIAKKIGKKEGFLLIMEKQTAGVMYSPDSIDITKKIITEYNKVTAK